MFKIKIAKNAGFCFGVKRAVDLVETTAKKKSGTVCTLGPVIHNPQEVERLAKQGIKILSDPKEIKNGYLILRTHGIPFELREKLEKNKLINVIDATCPFVKRAQNIVKVLSSNEKYKGATIVLVGERVHPEVVALVSYCRGRCIIIENTREAKMFKGSGDLHIVSQTTQNPKSFASIVNVLRERHNLEVHNTICEATINRQKSAEALAKDVDLMIVIGGRNSGNTTRLAQICSAKTRTYHVETVTDLKDKWFKNVESIGLTAGASTPDWIRNEIETMVKKIGLKNQKKI
ncbi:MAG: 4-hydroxy-3-methylbut-2-enyl diphosphate reductase [Endomicrobium sp.]|jgi:4-hydroxy-3-methylbut-2-enyl diphosphate reductase|nr:4-hydroxy-3-methylbut-2-enyl diphosphate reductase [Endomicrobium sp.]